MERRTHSEVLYEIEFQAEDFKSLIGENIYTSKLCSLYHKTETASPYQGEISSILQKNPYFSEKLVS